MFLTLNSYHKPYETRKKMLFRLVGKSSSVSTKSFESSTFCCLYRIDMYNVSMTVIILSHNQRVQHFISKRSSISNGKRVCLLDCIKKEIEK